MTLPRAIGPMVDFSAILRARGFAVAPDQVMGWIEATGLLGPRSIKDLRRAGIALLAIPKDRETEFNALFDAHFLGTALPAALPGEDEVEAHEPSGIVQEIPETEDTGEPGAEATPMERLAHRTLGRTARDRIGAAHP